MPNPFSWQPLDTDIVLIASGLCSCLLLLPCVFLLRHMLDRVVPLRNSRLAQRFLLLIFLLFLNLPVFIGDVNLLYILPFFFAAMLFCIQAPLTVCLTFTLNFFCLIAELAAVHTALVPNLSLYQDRPLLYFIYFTLANLPTLILLLLLQAFWGKLDFSPQNRPQLSPRLWRVAFFMALFTFLSLFLCIAMPIFSPYWSDSPLQRAFQSFFILQNFLMTPFILLSLLINFYVIGLLSDHERLLQSQILYESNRTYYQQLEQSQQAVRRLRHDLANHLQTMQHLSDHQLRAYLNELLHTPAMQTHPRFCANAAVNAVLQHKSLQIDQAEIQAEIAVSLPENLPIQDIDLCALFANGLDNAIEACRPLPKDERRLSVHARTDKGLFVLQICNRTDNPSPLPPDMLPESTKKDRVYHGLGLKNLKEIAERYHGVLSLRRESGTFELLITIPLPAA